MPIGETNLETGVLMGCASMLLIRKDTYVLVERRYREISQIHCRVLLQVRRTSNNVKAMNE